MNARFQAYGLDNYSFAMEDMENLNLQTKIDNVQESLSKIALSLENELAIYNSGGGQGTINADYERVDNDESGKGFINRIAAVLRRIGEFFSRIFSAIIDYVSNLAVFKKRMVERDKRNLETLKKTSTNKFDFKRPLSIPVNPKLIYISDIKNEHPELTVHQIQTMDSDVRKFYDELLDANVVSIEKTGQCLKAFKSVIEGKITNFNPMILRNGFKKALEIDNIVIHRVVQIIYKDHSNNFESVYDITEMNKTIPNGGILTLNSEKDVLDSIKAVTKLSEDVVRSESLIVDLMSKMTKQLKEVKRSMDICKISEAKVNSDFILKMAGIAPEQKPLFIEMFSAMRHMFQNCVDLLRPILSADKFISGAYSSFLNNYVKAIA